MRIKYPKAIQESEEDLTRLEQRLRGQKAADRVRLLRLLKSGAVNSLSLFCQIGFEARNIVMLSGSHKTDERSSRACF